MSGQDLQQTLALAQKDIQAGQNATAESRLKPLVESNNEAIDETLVYLLAVSQRLQDKHDEALETQSRLINQASQFARIYQERGHTLLSLNDLADAQRAYEKAVNLNPALVACWQALLNLYELHDGALNSTVEQHKMRAKSQLEYLLALPPELVTVNSYLAENKLYEADRLCRYYLRENKTHIEGMRLLAEIGARTGVLNDAEFLLETALELAPDNSRVRYDYANLLLRMQKFEKAHEQTSVLSQHNDDLRFLSLHANALAGVGDQEGAIDVYNLVIKASANQNQLLVMRGHAHKTIGQLGEAVASYQAAYEIKADYGDAYWSLANTKTYQFSEAELVSMQAQERSESVDVEDRIHLCFALGKAFEDRQHFARSFEYYERGNQLKKASVKHKPEYLSIRASAQKAICTAEFFANRSRVGHADPAPIFIVGLPRAGSTLLEQILSSHSQVDGTMELPNIVSLAQRLRGTGAKDENSPRYPQILAELDFDLFKRFGEQFIEQTQVYRQSAAFFVDKNPNNFFHVGLIKLILPNAKVIDARRHPMSCCLSGFKQLFGQGQEFSYGLRDIGNYYREYVELMTHWDEVLPGFVHLVQHEDLIADLEGEVRKLLGFCGLEFEQACLDYHKTERSVRTPSSEQVRQPIFTSSMDTWKHYEPWLGPLKEALGPGVRAQYGV
ncbi:MAG: sulfotransferase [Pseudomonadota bacterium]